MILVIDNYDSFTYNLVQMIGTMTTDIRVLRNDKITLDDIAVLRPERILLSPGPGRPENAGICVDLIRRFGATIPILGVCLGHQAIGYAYGAIIERAPTLMHGKTSSIYHDLHDVKDELDDGIFRGVPDPFIATRYHSLVVSPRQFPSELEVTARTSDGIIMGLRHRSHPVNGIQFHPESILTEVGKHIVENWIEQLQVPV